MKIIDPLNWRSELGKVKTDAIGEDFVLFQNSVISSALNYPFKIDVVVAIICTKGYMKGSVNMKQYEAKSPCLFIVLPNQILQYEELSEDFQGNFIIMSRSFANNLLINLQDRAPLHLSVTDNPWTPLNSEDLKVILYYYKMLQSTVRMTSNPYRVEIVKHLTQALFYGLSYQFHKIPDSENKSKHQELVDAFLNLVQANYKKYREVAFYADKLCFTQKYLSKVIKDSSGTSAAGWINNFVVLEAKALLKSTNMTVQQISDELNFPSQSFFGKYFKRNVGESPKEYRKK